MPPPKALFRTMNRIHIGLYRASKGKILGAIAGSPVLLLTVTGRKTGKTRTVPLVYTRDGDVYAVIASDHPGWYSNLHSAAQGTIEVKGQTYRVRERAAIGDEEQRLWDKFVAQSSAFASFRGKPNHQLVVLDISSKADS
jgi:F420H(2)-dependent quinone reductase